VKAVTGIKNLEEVINNEKSIQSKDRGFNAGDI